MRKFLVVLSTLLLVAIVILKVANAQTNPQEVKKASTETKMDCTKCPQAKDCPMMTAAKTSDTKACDPAKCKGMTADASKCTAKTEGCKEMSTEAKAACCKGATADAKAEPKACCKK
jgi:hypothetical protein